MLRISMNYSNLVVINTIKFNSLVCKFRQNS